MVNIDIDFEVFKELTSRRASENASYNDVLREILKMEPALPVESAEEVPPGDWVVAGVRFPEGTQLRATHKGRLYSARVQDGGLMLNGEKFLSPSAAGVSISGYAVNGWTFWECRMPGASSWHALNSLRKTALHHRGPMPSRT